ncbi:uncharacterized protein FIBRA_06539 [Fibroporia radiculosa]|uniref:Altered inheritance of mitochondria protein 41 n=1 Tax=Fibroporia radiculosa TaxID=599839 RepID=J4IBB4_9APHY|nr:uncharacterized protein FIBRA_06539 [Fibroporia radiculosa]CCM04366.1 predicted protein [Fibroporia radiculosa]
MSRDRLKPPLLGTAVTMFKMVLRSGSGFPRTQNALLRRMTTSSMDNITDVRAQLTTELKAAMRSKNTMKSTAIRSVLAELYLRSSEKQSSDGQVPSAPSFARARWANPIIHEQTESAAEFEKASRSDLAQKEKDEADLLQAFVPPLLPEAEIDRVLRQVFSEHPQLAGEASSRKALGLVYKAFYTKVDRSSVDSDLVRKRAEALLAAEARPA